MNQNKKLLERLNISCVLSGLKKNEIAESMSVASSVISSVLKGKREFKLKQLEFFANVCGVSFAWLCTGEGEAKK